MRDERDRQSEHDERRDDGQASEHPARSDPRDRHDDDEHGGLEREDRDGMAGGSGDDHREGDRAHELGRGVQPVDRRVDRDVEPTQVAAV